MNGVVALELNEGEEVVLQSDAKHQKRDGTLILTNHRLIFCRAATNEVMVQIPLKDLHSHFVSKSAAPPLFMKVMTEEDERRRLEEESKKKPNVRERTTRKKKTFGRVFEFTSRLGPESAFGERDGFRDLIAQFVPLHKKLAQEAEAEAEEEVNKKKRTREGEEDSEEATKLEMDLMQVMEKAEEEQQQTKKARMEEQRQRGKPMVGRVGEQAKLRLEEAKQRAALLAGNDTLRALHDELVISGIISEEEFWSSRKQMLETEAQSVAKQQRGMSSELLADVKPALETCNAVHYRLTPTVIRQIFVEYPAVKKAYEEWVPDKLSETEFWTKYFQSQYFHKSRGGGSSASASSSASSGRPKEVMDSSVYSADEVFAGCAEEDDELIQEDSARLGAKVKHVEITSNLALARDTLITDDGYGNVSDSVVGPTAPKASRALTLLRRYNRHGALVLGTDRSLLSGGGSSSSLSSATNNSQLAKRLQDKMKEEEEKEKEKEKQKEEAKKRSTSPPPQRNKENGIREGAKDGHNHNHSASLNKQAVQQSTEWTELEERKEEQVVELNITDQRRYFEGHTSTGILGDSDSESTPEQLWERWSNELRYWLEENAPAPPPPPKSKKKKKKENEKEQEEAYNSSAASVSIKQPKFIPSQVAMDIVLDIGKLAKDRTHHRNNSSSEQQEEGGQLAHQMEQLSEEDKRKLFANFTRANELLRHFWGSYPITSKALADKVTRVANSIGKLYDDIQKERLQKRGIYAKVLAPILQALDKAVEMRQSKRTLL